MQWQSPGSHLSYNYRCSCHCQQIEPWFPQTQFRKLDTMQQINHLFPSNQPGPSLALDSPNCFLTALKCSIFYRLHGGVVITEQRNQGDIWRWLALPTKTVLTGVRARSHASVESVQVLFCVLWVCWAKETLNYCLLLQSSLVFGFYAHFDGLTCCFETYRCLSRCGETLSLVFSLDCSGCQTWCR